CQQHNSLPYSF
nr:immunoglobulin light chain junction region [Macaca mulatta]MOV75434.1 immunoglobulin light chain junction region [Macaca mulatta]MOW09384.1 immunoglobulin light chain junction region [Macaca mulatta]MOW12325.1 immunoglobulin light chain junction region [Macaca mulatta]MOW12587.1 immunoglobulin light chain junction region [Macaca mulatta]